MRHEVREAATRAEVEAAIALRLEVFCGEQGVPLDEEVDALDEAAVHLVAVEDGALVGTCRLLQAGDRVQLGRLVVRADRRGHGIAQALLALSAQRARAAGARRITLNAQTAARRTYERAGYATTSGVFEEAGIEHVRMELTL